jgi:hypothetical protein
MIRMVELMRPYAPFCTALTALSILVHLLRILAAPPAAGCGRVSSVRGEACQASGHKGKGSRTGTRDALRGVDPDIHRVTRVSRGRRVISLDHRIFAGRAGASLCLVAPPPRPLLARC